VQRQTLLTVGPTRATMLFDRLTHLPLYLAPEPLLEQPNRKLQNRATVSSQKHELSEGVIGASLLTVGLQNPREDAHRM